MRCKACDSILEPSEIIWIEELGQHEDFCRKCRDVMFDEVEMPIQYDDDYEDITQ